MEYVLGSQLIWPLFLLKSAETGSLENVLQCPRDASKSRSAHMCIEPFAPHVTTEHPTAELLINVSP